MKLGLPYILSFGLLNSCAVASTGGYEAVYRQCDEHRAYFNQCVRRITCGVFTDDVTSEADSSRQDISIYDSGVQDMFLGDFGVQDMYNENLESNICNVSDDSNLSDFILDACESFKNDYDNCMNQINSDVNLDAGVSNDIE